MADRLFTMKDWEMLKKDNFDDFFNEHNLVKDAGDLMKAQVNGDGTVPPGFHVMPTGELMADSEMPEGMPE